MKVRDVMAGKPYFCGWDWTLSAAAKSMWKNGCGFLPVVGEGGNVIGVVTDRDISIALGTRNRRPSELLVKEVMRPRLFTCTADDSIHCALKTMRAEKIRRLPVIDLEGTLMGVLSIDDIVLKARKSVLSKDVSYKDVEDTYLSICGPVACVEHDCAAA